MTAQQLKNSILQMAVQGKLVPQNADDEPASVLLERIRAEKQELIKQGKIKKEKPLSPISDDEIPFDIPESWEWVKVNEYVEKVTDYVASGSFASLRENVKNYKEPNYAILVKTKDFQSNFTSDLTYTDKHGYEFLENSRLFGGELIMPNIGASIGKVFEVPYLKYKMTLAPNSVLIRFINNEHKKWFSVYFLSPLGYSQLKNISSSTAQAKFSKTDFKNLYIPVPPLSEQKRIVEKIEELLPFIEQYEKAETQLNTLNTSFPDMLKKSILQYAVQGKLVPQNAYDEPASVLLERIQAEKQELIKQGKIKKEKSLSPISDDEIPFDIPENWEWVRLSSICTKLVDGDHNPPKGENTTTKYFMLSSTNINNNTIVELDKVRYLNKEIFEKEDLRTKVSLGDIFFTSVGSLGRSCVFQGGYNICFQRSVTVISTLIYNYYLKYFFDNPYFQDKIIREATGTAQKGFYLNQLSECLIPIPPLAEQKRIVEKIEELMPIIDKINK